MRDIRRTREMDEQYARERATKADYTHLHHFDPAADTVVREFTHWYIIDNNFPYDRITETHHMLVPKRVFGRLEEANSVEANEYHTILHTLEEETFYDSLQINFFKDRSVCAHYHVHLIVWKKTTEEAYSDPQNG